MKNIIGQAKAKEKLEIFGKAFKETSILDPLLFVGMRGGGKTKLVREFRKTLQRPDGSTPKIIEINAATVKSHIDFFEQVWPVWQAERAFLFFDEAHNLPDKLLEIFLTLLEKDSDRIVREVTINYRDIGPILYQMDITRMHIAFGTTDHNSLPDPLLDRLTEICLERYTDEQLMAIFLDRVKVPIDDSVKSEVVKYFRGHPRDAVAKGDDLMKYVSAKNKEKVGLSEWKGYCYSMGVFPLGLNEAEINILKLIEERRNVSLTGISAATGYSTGVIRQKYEKSLLSKGLMDIQGTRFITQKGRTYLKELV